MVYTATGRGLFSSDCWPESLSELWATLWFAEVKSLLPLSAAVPRKMPGKKVPEL